MGDEIKPAVTALRAKLAEMEKSVSVDERQFDQLRLSLERQREDIVAVRRSISLLEQAPAMVTPTGASRGLGDQPINVATVANSGRVQPSPLPFAAQPTNGQSSNGHIENPARLDGHILTLMKASPRPLGPINIRDALLKQNVPGAHMLLGSTHLYNVLNRLTKRGYLVKDGEGYRFGVEPPPRDPVNWERCASVLSEAGRPLSFSDIASLVNERWDLDWGAIQAKWAIKGRKQVFELVHQGTGLWALREWPEGLKAAYRIRGPKKRRRTKA